MSRSDFSTDVPPPVQELRVLVGFTTEADHEARLDRFNIREQVELALFLIERALAEAGAPVAVRSADSIEEVAYAQPQFAEDGGYVLDTMVKALIEADDPALVAFRQKRDRLRAQVGVLIVHDDDPEMCGWAGDVSASPRAFVVVNWKCMTSKSSLMHEVGHLLGANHQNVNPPPEPPYARAFVHDVLPEPFVDVMGYERECAITQLCVREPFFSSPNKKVRGITIGTPESVDNARRVTAYLQTVLPY